MPTAFVLRLAGDGDVPAALSASARAWFLDRWLTAGLGQPLVLPPFALAALPAAAGTLMLRVAIFDDDAAQLVLDLLANEQNVALDGVTFRVTALAQTRQEYALAGRTSWDELAAPLLGEITRPPSFEFLSPVLWSGADSRAPLPLPELVFGSLLERWNAFAPAALPDDLTRFAAECLALREFEISSRRTNLPGRARIGFIGRVRYAITRHDPFWTAPLAVLAAFAAYAGVGTRTDEGFGLTRPII